MDCVNVGAQRWLRWGVCGLAVAIGFLAITTDPADARKRRKRVVYNPPYADIVVDVNSGRILRSKNADALRHPASLTKIMTLYLLFERIEAGRITLRSSLPVSEHASIQAPSKLGLKPGQSIVVEDAIKALVTKSANDVAVVVSEAIGGTESKFAAMMTAKARELGMKRTVYRNASGLPDQDQVTTARDQAQLGRAIQHHFPKQYKYFSTRVFHHRGRALRNHNRLLGRVKGVDGIKTGYIRASGFNLVTSMHRGSRHVVAVVMGGRTGRARDAQMERLLDKYIAAASTKRTIEAAVKKPELRSDPTPVAAIPRARPTPGSDAPIRPIMVKTLSVKPGTIQVAGLAPLHLPSAPSPAPGAKRAAAATEVQSDPPPPPGAGRGVLGTLPVQSRDDSATSGVETTPTSMPHAEVKKTVRPRSGWMIQVGAFAAEDEAKDRLSTVQNKAARLLSSADPFTEIYVKGETTYYRARFAGLKKDQAVAACKYLKRKDVACMPLKN